MTALIETIIEGGPLTDEQARKALAGKKNLPEIKAVLSRVEYAIGMAREESEAAGCAQTVRDEACGAARHLRVLREDLIKLLASDQRPE